MSLYLGENLISGSKPINLGVRNIGEIVASSLPLTDAGLHLLDGSLILGGGIYQGFVDYIAELYAENPSANYFTTEALWQQSVTTYGVCGKFVYDSVNNTVRLPKITGIIEGTVDLSALGDLVEAGLPVHTHTRGNMNITGTAGIYVRPTYATGAFYLTGTGNNTNDLGPYGNGTINLDASRTWTGSTSNPDYTNNIQNSSTVQPQTIKTFYYIVIANSTKTEIQTDIDEIATDLNGKADVDLTNCTDVANIKMAHNAMPSNTYVDLTLGASGAWYTAPADGFITFRKQASASGQYMQITTGNGRQFWVQSSSANGLVAVAIPVSKGESYGVSYTLAGTSYQVFRFIYAIGSESEAS